MAQQDLGHNGNEKIDPDEHLQAEEFVLGEIFESRSCQNLHGQAGGDNIDNSVDDFLHCKRGNQRIQTNFADQEAVNKAYTCANDQS